MVLHIANHVINSGAFVSCVHMLEYESSLLYTAN